VAEWFKAHAWKACGRETVSRVRISPHPFVVQSLTPVSASGGFSGGKGWWEGLRIQPVRDSPWATARRPVLRFCSIARWASTSGCWYTFTIVSGDRHPHDAWRVPGDCRSFYVSISCKDRRTAPEHRQVDAHNLVLFAGNSRSYSLALDQDSPGSSPGGATDFADGAASHWRSGAVHVKLGPRRLVGRRSCSSDPCPRRSR
jgi:hypothetical protein